MTKEERKIVAEFIYAMDNIMTRKGWDIYILSADNGSKELNELIERINFVSNIVFDLEMILFAIKKTKHLGIIDIDNARDFLGINL